MWAPSVRLHKGPLLVCGDERQGGSAGEKRQSQVRLTEQGIMGWKNNAGKRENQREGGREKNRGRESVLTVEIRP